MNLTDEEASLLLVLKDMVEPLEKPFQQPFEQLRQKVLCVPDESPFYIKMPKGSQYKETKITRVLEKGILDHTEVRMSLAADTLRKLTYELKSLKIMDYDGFCTSYLINKRLKSPASAGFCNDIPSILYCYCSKDRIKSYNMGKRGFMQEYLTTKEAAEKWNISQRRVLVFCQDNRIPELSRIGNMWLIPSNTSKPADNRHLRYVDTRTVAKPFLKWAGGKTQLLEDINKRMSKLPHFEKYAEPFVGGGALLFHVLANYPIKQAYISDINADLINTYVMVKTQVEKLIKTLSGIEKEFLGKNEAQRKTYYYQKRNRFNTLVAKQQAQKIEKAALFIFLNHTCFNGLYRVNRKGEFNVPMGSYKNPLICDADNLRKVSKLLQKVEIVCADYKESMAFIDKKTMVYFDPPYRPLTQTASFTSYTKEEFDDNAQIELAHYVEKVHSKHAKILLSNSDPHNVNPKDSFFDKLYSAFNIERVLASRMINCKDTARGKIKELLIANF